MNLSSCADTRNDEAVANSPTRENVENSVAGRWNFVSKVSPLIAGCFLPIANTFSICSLCQAWRLRTGDGTSTPIANPAWLIAINAIGLACGLVSNLVLFLQFGSCLPFTLAQTAATIGCFLTSLILIATVIYAALERRHGSTNFGFTQAYYYAVEAAGLYFLVSLNIAFLLYGAKRKYYQKELSIGKTERKLLLQQVLMMTYLLIGAVIFAQIENWLFLDGVFWADFTILTIGLGGEYSPQTSLGRLLFIPYALGGVIIVGIEINSISGLLEKAKRKMRSHLLKRKAIAMAYRIRSGGKLAKNVKPRRLPNESRDEHEYKVMRRLQKTSSRQSRWIGLGFSVMGTFGLWLGGAAIFQASESVQSWTYIISIYFAFGALLTVGYGDFLPTTPSSKSFFVLWTLFAIPILTITIANSADTTLREAEELLLLVGSWTILPEGKQVKKMVRTLSMHPDHTELPEEDISSGEHGMPSTGYEVHAGEKSALRNIKRDLNFYQHLIPKEICKVLEHRKSSPAKEYNYQEWQYFMQLIREEQNFGSKEGIGSLDQPSIWLSDKSPLLSDNESEWVLDGLAGILRKRHRSEGSRNENNTQEERADALDVRIELIR
ncbi:potassium channel-like protein [Halenospora varia]|nr:potassium channel-like protein [Halenospora varia]